MLSQKFGKLFFRTSHRSSGSRLGEFWKFLDNEFPYTSSPKTWDTYWAVLKRITLLKSAVGSIYLGNFWKTYSNIWSHCTGEKFSAIGQLEQRPLNFHWKYSRQATISPILLLACLTRTGSPSIAPGTYLIRSPEFCRYCTPSLLSILHLYQMNTWNWLI